MNTRLKQTTTLFLGAALIVGQASVAYAHGGGGEYGTTDILGMFGLTGLLAVVGYVIMVNEIPQRILGILPEDS